MDRACICPLKSLYGAVQTEGDLGNSAGPWGGSDHKTPGDSCIAIVPDWADRGVCGNICQFCSFYLLLLPIAFLTERTDLAGNSNQTAVLGRGKRPRLPWTGCERDNSGKKGSVIPLMLGTDDLLLVTVLWSELGICIMK